MRRPVHPFLRCLHTPLIAALSLAALSLAGNARALDCQLLSVPALTFGTYDPLAPRPLEGRTQMQVDCRAAPSGERAALQIRLIGATVSGALRAMQGPAPGDELRFSLYRNPQLSIALAEDGWIAINDTVVGDRSFVIPLYGQIFAGQRQAGAGAYHAGILLTVDY